MIIDIINIIDIILFILIIDYLPLYYFSKRGDFYIPITAIKTIKTIITIDSQRGFSYKPHQ